MAKTALDRAIAKEERASKTRSIEKVQEKAEVGAMTSAGTATLGVVAAAAHDAWRGEVNPETGQKEVAKFGPVPANLAIGGVTLLAGALLPKKKVSPVIRGGVGGLGLGQALGGLYRLTYDNWPESDEEE